MKILTIVPNPFFTDRGSCIRILGQVRYLADRGHEVIVLSYGYGREVPSITIKRIIKTPGYDENSIGASFARLYNDLFLLIKSIVYTLKFKPDVIHGHLHEGALMGIVSSVFRKTRVLLDAEGSLSGELRDRAGIKNEFLQQIIRGVEIWINNHVDCVVASSPIVGDDMEKRLGIEKSRINIVPDGVNMDFFKKQDNMGLRSKLNIPPGKKVIVYAGVLNEFYGTDCLLKAARLVLNKIKDVHFLIIGYPNAELYRKTAQESGISESVTFTGKVQYEHMPEYLMQGDIAVAPKLKGTEGTLKLSQYMAAGLPVVAFDTISHREILGDEGIYAAESGSEVSLAEALVKALNDPETGLKGARLKAKVQKEFSLDSINSRLVELYLQKETKQ